MSVAFYLNGLTERVTAPQTRPAVLKWNGYPAARSTTGFRRDYSSRKRLESQSPTMASQVISQTGLPRLKK